MENKTERFSDITPEMIQAWKAHYGEHNIFQTDIEKTEDKVYRFIVCTPSRAVVDALTKKNQEPSQSNKIAISNCVLGGDMQALERDGGVYSAVLEEIGKLIKVKSARLKKL